MKTLWIFQSSVLLSIPCVVLLTKSNLFQLLWLNNIQSYNLEVYYNYFCSEVCDFFKTWGRYLKLVARTILRLVQLHLMMVIGWVIRWKCQLQHLNFASACGPDILTRWWLFYKAKCSEKKRKSETIFFYNMALEITQNYLCHILVFNHQTTPSFKGRT